MTQLKVWSILPYSSVVLKTENAELCVTLTIFTLAMKVLICSNHYETRIIHSSLSWLISTNSNPQPTIQLCNLIEPSWHHLSYDWVDTEFGLIFRFTGLITNKQIHYRSMHYHFVIYYITHACWVCHHRQVTGFHVLLTETLLSAHRLSVLAGKHHPQQFLKSFVSDEQGLIVVHIHSWWWLVFQHCVGVDASVTFMTPRFWLLGLMSHYVLLDNSWSLSHIV
jgi:hypothetical protein